MSKNNNPFKIHSKDDNGNFVTSGFSSDPNNSWGRFLSVGNTNSSHTTFVRNSNGVLIDIKVDGKSIKPKS